MRSLRAAALFLVAASPLLAQAKELPLKYAPRPTAAPISAADLMTRLYVFADDSMQGRQVGTEGHLRGTAYIEREVRRLGLQPGGDDGGYFQDIGVRRVRLAERPALGVAGRAFTPFVDFAPLAYLATARDLAGAPVVYGGVLGDTSGRARMIDPDAAAGKFVVFLAPRAPDGSRIWQINWVGVVRRYLGARAVALATLDAIPAEVRGQIFPPASVEQSATPSPQMPPLPWVLAVSDSMAAALLGRAPEQAPSGAAGGTITGGLALARDPAPGRNVVAILPGSDPTLRGQYVAIGAHNDHVGMGAPVDHDSVRAYNTVVRPGGAEDPERPATPEEWTRIRALLDSLRKIHPPRQDSIFNGADDDGSGTVSVLEIAEALAKAPTKPKRSIVFVWHAGEEMGMWGSEYFTDHPTVPRDSIVAQLNMDMVGRGAATDVKGGGPGYLQLIGSRRLSTELGDLVEAVARTQPTPFRLDYQFDANGHPQQYYCRSDHYEYARYGIPIAFFSTGGHRDYHQVTDEPQYIDYDQMARVASLVRDIAVRVADLDHRVVVDRPKPDPHGQCVQ